MKRKDKRSRNGQPRTASGQNGATSKLGALCPELQGLRSIVVQAKSQAPAPAPVPPALPRVGPKPKLTSAAQSRLDDGFEAQMLAKRAAAEAAETAERERVSRLRRKLVSAPKSEEAEAGPRPILAPRIERDVVAEVRQALRGATLAIEDRPTEMPKDASENIERTIIEGSKSFADNDGPDLAGGFIIGFDLGTSSLKVAFRQPYQAGDPVVALDVPDALRSNGHPLLWQTVVWYNTKVGRFTLYPTPGAHALAGFKTGVIGGNGTAPVSSELDVSRSEATVAFIALHLAYVLGWYQSERPLGSIGGDWFLSVNVGIPVAGLDDRETFETFAKITAAAATLASRASDLRLADVREALRQSLPILPPGFKLVPELVAAIAGYAVEPTSNVGAHVLVDVGASTLDIVAFNFIERSRVSVFTAGVDVLGAGALEYARKVGIPDAEFKKGCDALFDSVYGVAKSTHRAPSLFHPLRRRQDVQLLTTGGGCESSLHAEFIGEMPKPAVLGDLPIVRPVPPRGITKSECDLSRLLLAYGLTRDDFEIVDLRRPSEIADLPPSNSPTPAYLSPEQTYD